LNRPIRSTSKTVVFPPLELPGGVLLSTLGPFTRTHFDWQFSVLGKYRLSENKLKPFVESGVSFLPIENEDKKGISLGAGMELRAARLNFAPGLRYTRWTSNLGAHEAPNQVQFLVSVSEPSDTIRPKAFGRNLSLGVVAGITLNKGLRPATSNQQADTINAIGGLTVNSPLVKNVSLEVNGLYRPMHITEGSLRNAFLTWEFPALLKYTVNRPRISPFAEFGPAYRVIAHANPDEHSHSGITTGVGMKTRLSKLAVEPAVRYARWAQDKDRLGRNTDLSTRQDQIELVIGFSFRGP